MGMSETEFYNITPRTFENKVIGFRRKEEADSRESWEQTRRLAVFLISPNLKKGAKINDKELFPTPWDQAIAQPKEDPKEAYKRADAMWAEIDKKRQLKK